MEEKQKLKDLEYGVEMSIDNYELLLKKAGYHPVYLTDNNGKTYIHAMNTNMRKDKFYEIIGNPLKFNNKYRNQIRFIEEVLKIRI